MTQATDIPEVTAAIEEFIKAVKGEEVEQVIEQSKPGASAYHARATTATAASNILASMMSNGTTPF